MTTKINKIFLSTCFLGKGDLVGCDISKHLAASALSNNCPEVIVKSSCDVRALTYCDLKCLNIPGTLHLYNFRLEVKFVC